MVGLLCFGLTYSSASAEPRLLDLLSHELQTMAVASPDADIAQKERATGFPDLQEVSRKMLEHVRASLIAAEAETGIKVLYAGFDPYCSVGRGLALPRSDIDFLHVIVPEGAVKEAFFQSFEGSMSRKPWLVNLEGIKAQRVVLNFDDLTVPTNPQSDDERQKHYLLTVVSRSLHGAGGKGQILTDPTCLEELRSKIPWDLDSANQRTLETMASKPKLLTRQPLVRAYPTLSLAEQKIVWRLIETNPDCDDTSFLDLADNNPDLTTIRSLHQKGLLVEIDPASSRYQISVTKLRKADSSSPWFLEELTKMGPRLVAPWRPGHSDEPVINDICFSHPEPAKGLTPDMKPET